MPGTETLEIIVCHIIWKDVRCSTGVLGDRSWRFLLHWKGRVYAYIRHCVKKKKKLKQELYMCIPICITPVPIICMFINKTSDFTGTNMLIIFLCLISLSYCRMCSLKICCYCFFWIKYNFQKVIFDWNWSLIVCPAFFHKTFYQKKHKKRKKEWRKMVTCSYKDLQNGERGNLR